jgi:hypothetical protein
MVVHQIKGEFQCFDSLLNSYLDQCLVKVSRYFQYQTYISKEDNSRANFLAQQASG